MKRTYKPEGYNSLSPYLVVAGAQRLIDLLKKIFDIKELRRFENQDGKIVHAEIQIDDTVLMIADGNDNFPPSNTLLHVYVEDVDRIYKKALGAGCTSGEEPKTREGDPDKRGAFIDFAGNMWSIGTQQS